MRLEQCYYPHLAVLMVDPINGHNRLPTSDVWTGHTYLTLLEKSSSVSNSCKENTWMWDWSKERVLLTQYSSSCERR